MLFCSILINTLIRKIQINMALIDSPCRVLHCFALYGNPSEIWGYRLLEGLHLAGVEQQIAAFEFWDGHFPTQPWPQWRLNLLPPVLGAVGRWCQRQWYPGRLASQIDPASVDVIHAHFGHTAWRYLPLVKRLKKPFIVSFYGMDYTLLPLKDPKWLVRYTELFDRADLVLSEGPAGAARLEELGCPVEKIRVSRLGIRPDQAPFLQRQKSVGRLNLIQIASFIEKKGHVYTLAAFKEALRSAPDMHLTLAGDGAGLRGQLTRLVAEWRLEQQVTIRDFIPYHQLHQFLADFDVFIHPSCHAANGDCEGGAPTILLEAQATGLPVIATTHCDIPSEVAHGHTGLLTPEKDTAALTASILTFCHMPDHDWQKYSRSAREHTERLFDIRKNAAGLTNIYYSAFKNS